MDLSSESMAWLARRDGSVVLGHGPFTESAEPPDDGVAFYVQDFALCGKTPWKKPASIERLSDIELSKRFTAPENLKVEWSNPDATLFSEVFQEVMASIAGGIFEKTVPVVTETGAATIPPGYPIMAAMARQQSPLHSYGWITGDSGFAGATPELLFSLDGMRLETMALAGTARSEDQDVFAVDEKEIREHEYVAQTLVSKLHDLGSVARLPREILDLGPIVHFLTTISVQLNFPQAAEELLKKLHPTPALGPLPRTVETLGQLLNWRARLHCPSQFGAPFGLWDGGKFDAIVAIRGIWWQENQLILPAGCGIIEASRLVNEWRELRLKREAVKRFIATPCAIT